MLRFTEIILLGASLSLIFKGVGHLNTALRLSFSKHSSSGNLYARFE